MLKMTISAFVGWCVILSATQALACANFVTGHSHFAPGKMGFVGGALVRLAGLGPDRVFKLDHPPTTKVPIGEESEVVIDYDRPWLSSNVTIELAGSKNVTIIDDTLELSDFDGSVRARFTLTGDGFDSITLTVSGEHKGETVRESSKIYVRARRVEKAQPLEDVQVSSR